MSSAPATAQEIATKAALMAQSDFVEAFVVDLNGVLRGKWLQPDKSKSLFSPGIAMPRSVVRLSAGREAMSDEAQALCFLAGANSIFRGPMLLTTPNVAESRDAQLMARLGLRPMQA